MSGDAITFWSFDAPDTATLVSVRPLLEFCCHWSGIHFRTADVVGRAQGKKAGDWALDHYFKPAR